MRFVNFMNFQNESTVRILTILGIKLIFEDFGTLKKPLLLKVVLHEVVLFYIFVLEISDPVGNFKSPSFSTVTKTSLKSNGVTVLNLDFSPFSINN